MEQCKHRSTENGRATRVVEVAGVATGLNPAKAVHRTPSTRQAPDAIICPMSGVRHTRTAQVETTPDGIVITRIRPDIDQRLSDAVENIAVSAEACGGRRAPIVVDLRRARALDAETRHYYSGKRLTESFTAIALLVPAGAFGRMMGNLYLRVANPGIPARLFDSESAALAWSARHLLRVGARESR